MENAFYLVLGTLISCWIAKYAHFKELRLRAYEALIEVTMRDAAQRFSSNNRYIIDTFFPIQIAFYAAGHTRAGLGIQKIAEELTADFVELQTKPVADSALKLILDPPLEMKIAAYMKESSMPDKIGALPYDWDAVLKPF